MAYDSMWARTRSEAQAMQSSSIGLGKTIFNSGVAHFPMGEPRELQICLTERLNRSKNSGAWPIVPLTQILQNLPPHEIIASENRDVQAVTTFEDYCDTRFPFREKLRLLGLEKFAWFDRPQETVSHHMAHAYGSLLFSPFTNCLVAVMDGAGSPFQGGHEHFSLFKWDNGVLTLLEKDVLKFEVQKELNRSLSEGMGLFYEEISEFIFNRKTEAGKVMGLAPFGKSLGLQKSPVNFLKSLDWSKKFQGKGKIEWEASPHMKYYQDLAATVQENFEHYLGTKLKAARTQYGEENLILTGGCALNCTFNGKLIASGLFRQVYIPPNPGDEGISMGCAAFNYFKQNPEWKPTPWERLSSYFGLKSSIPTHEKIHEVFSGYKVSQPNDLIQLVAQSLKEGEIVAWFQGRSECGPRALGNRSILATPLRKELKSYLNEHIKFRENFRPYGCTVPWELADFYFDVKKGFENPFMSYAVGVKVQFMDVLRDVTHVDGTSRMQTLHAEQNSRYHSLLIEMGKITGLPILLNTSLNVMNEPILETVEDARRFMDNSEIRMMVVENTLIIKPR